MVTKTMDERLIPVIQYTEPTAGATVNVNNNGYTRLILNPSGTLLTMTISMPSSHQDGDMVEIASSQIITTLTMNNGTLVGALAALVIRQ